MKTVLRKYFVKGWLKYGNKLISAQDRLNAANRFYADFYKAGIEDFRVPDLSKPRVDGGGKGAPDWVLDARARFNDAYKSMNIEQADLVMRVVCWNKGFNLKKKDLDYRHDLEVMKDIFCKALDALFVHYWGRPERSSVKIKGIISDKAMEDFNKWTRNLLG